VLVEVDEDSKLVWKPATVRSHLVAKNTYGMSFMVAIDGKDKPLERFTAREEGKEWRRLMPKRAEVIEVEVEIDGTVEWRRAAVTKRLFATGEFKAAICFPDGRPDSQFIEEFRLEAEDVEWRRAPPVVAVNAT